MGESRSCMILTVRDAFRFSFYAGAGRGWGGFSPICFHSRGHPHSAVFGESHVEFGWSSGRASSPSAHWYGMWSLPVLCGPSCFPRRVVLLSPLTSLPVSEPLPHKLLCARTLSWRLSFDPKDEMPLAVVVSEDQPSSEPLAHSLALTGEEDESMTLLRRIIRSYPRECRAALCSISWLKAAARVPWVGACP